MRIRLGDFHPRVDWSWPLEQPARCLKMGAHAVELSGALEIARVGAKHGDGETVQGALYQAQQAAAHLKRGLPGSKAVAGRVENRARMLRALTEPFRYEKKIPKKTMMVIEDQIRELGAYELALETAAIKDCGGRLVGAMREENPKLHALPKIPPEVKKTAQRQAAANKKATEAKAARVHAKWEREWKKTKAEMKKAEKTKGRKG